MAKNKQDDFDPEKILNALADTINQPHNFAEVFCDAARTQVAIKALFIETIRECLETDIETKKNVKKILTDFNRDYWINFLRIMGGGAGAIIFLIIGGVITKFLDMLFSSN